MHYPVSATKMYVNHCRRSDDLPVDTVLMFLVHNLVRLDEVLWVSFAEIEATTDHGGIRMCIFSIL